MQLTALLQTFVRPCLLARCSRCAVASDAVSAASETGRQSNPCPDDAMPGGGQQPNIIEAVAQALHASFLAPAARRLCHCRALGGGGMKCNGHGLFRLYTAALCNSFANFTGMSVCMMFAECPGGFH